MLLNAFSGSKRVIKETQLLRFEDEGTVKSQAILDETDIKKRKAGALETLKRHKEKCWMVIGGTGNEPRIFGQDEKTKKIVEELEAKHGDTKDFGARYFPHMVKGRR